MRMMLTVAALCVFGEDVWKTKPYTEWSEKDVKRILTNSPWAKEVSVSMGGGGGGGASAAKGRRGGGGGAPSFDASEGGSGGGGGMRGGGGGGTGEMGGSGAPSMTVKIRWQTALPIKQALLRQRFGDEVGTSSQAQTVLKGVDDVYLLVLEGLPLTMAQRGGQRFGEMVKRGAQLKHGGKNAIAAGEVQMGVVDKKLVLYFVFPRTDAITLEDKDVEFVSKVGPMEIKRKFKLAEMVVDGKLKL